MSNLQRNPEPPRKTNAGRVGVKVKLENPRRVMSLDGEERSQFLL